MKKLITKTDFRLGRLREFDSRSLSFPVKEVLPKEAKKPRSYTWAVPVQLDQGSEGACVGFAWSHELAARPAKMDWLENKDAIKIYKKAQTLDQWPGENYSGTSVIAGVKAVMDSYPKAYSEYRWAFSMDDLIMTLGYLGPVVLGVNWYSGFYRPDNNGVISMSGYVAGGHAILANKVDVKNKMIGLKNSWGTSWGKRGSCLISFKDMKKLLDQGGEACVPLGRNVVKP